ncbi:MAG: zinc ribbon domain-containing protein [Planctomycetes bacterium]|nr:zinc ribbon domain-containing protein [Planctomycetota bacterium]
MEAITCPECEAIQPAGSAFCENCGVKLVVAEKGSGRGAAYERSRARQEFGRIKQTVLIVRSVFWAMSAFAGLLVLLWFVALGQLGELGGNWRLALTVLVWGQLAVTIAGALLVTRAPLVWTTVGACWWTLDTVLNVWLGGLAPMNVFRLVLMVSFWFAVAQAARVQRLMAADPSLQLVRKRLDPELRTKGGIADTVQSRQRDDRRRTGRRRLAMFGVVALGLVAVVLVIGMVTRPPTVDATVQAFAERWARGDAEAIGQLFEEGAAGRRATSLRDDLEQRGWNAASPRLGEPEVVPAEGSALVHFPCGDGRLSVGFRYDERAGWLLTQVTLPPFEVPDLAPGIDAFRRAWAADGTDALVACLRPASRERLGTSLQRLLEKRDWHRQRPVLGDVDPGQPGRDRRKVLFALGNDELGVLFEFWHPQWVVVGVTLPRE